VVAIIREGKDRDAARHAANVLRQITDPTAAPIMLDEVGAGHPVVMDAVKQSLRKQPRIVSHLQVAAHDRRAVVREVAMYGLGGRVGGVETSEMIGGLADDFWRVREQAALSLGIEPQMEAMEPLVEAARYDSAGQVRAAALRSLAKYDDPAAIKAVVRGLYDEAHECRAGAAVAVIQLNQFDSLPRVFELLSDPHPAVRAAAAEALKPWPDRRAVRALIALLRDKDADVRRNAAVTLGLAEDVRAVPNLRLTLEDDVPAVRIASAEALGRIRTPRAIDALIQRLDNRLDHVGRRACASALGRANAFVAVPDLIKLLDDSDPQVVAAADEALSRLTLRGGRGVAMTPARWRDWWHNEREEAKQHIAALIGGGVSERIAAARGLRLNRTSDAVEALTRALKDEHVEVRLAAAQSLSYHNNALAGPALVEALVDSDERVRREASVALGAIRDPALVEGLIVKALFGERDDLQRRYVGALGTIGDARAIDPLLALVNDPDAPAGRAAASALEQVTGHRGGYDGKAWNRWWALNRHYYNEPTVE